MDARAPPDERTPPSGAMTDEREVATAGLLALGLAAIGIGRRKARNDDEPDGRAIPLDGD